MSTDSRIVQGVDGVTLIGAAVDSRQSPPTVSVWMTHPGGHTQGLNLSPSAARQVAARLTAAAAAIESPT